MELCTFCRVVHFSRPCRWSRLLTD